MSESRTTSILANTNDEVAMIRLGSCTFPLEQKMRRAAGVAVVAFAAVACAVPLNPPQWPMGDGDYMRSRSSGSSNALGLPLPEV